jgi:glutamate dehydrogenase (NAD(P)+)
MSKPFYEMTVRDRSIGLTGFLVIDQLQDGLAAGGVRMAADVTLGMTRRLARVMSYKYPAMGIRLGGAKGGIACRAAAPDRDEMISAYARRVEPFLRSCCLLGEDLGFDGRDVQLMYQSIAYDPVAFVRDRLERRGIALGVPDGFSLPDLTQASFERTLTGFGIAQAVDEACAALGFQVAGRTLAIQGFGTVGSTAAKHLGDQGARILAVADELGTIFHPDGLGVEVLQAAAGRFGVIDRRQLPSEYRLANAEAWLEIGAEILIPAAVSDAIRPTDVDKVSARLVVEGANLALAERVEEVLYERGVLIIPDFIANAGASAGFGLLITGTCRLGEVFPEVARRVRRAVRAVLESTRREPAVLPRQAAIRFAEAQANAGAFAPDGLRSPAVDV